MALGELNGIVQALIQKRQRDLQNQQLLQQQNQFTQAQRLREQQAEQEKNFQNAEIENRKQQLQQEHDQFVANLELLKNQAKVNRLIALQALSKGIQEGENVPGSKITGTRVDPTNGFTYNTYQLPINDENNQPISTELLSPESYGKLRGQQELAVQKPLLDMQLNNQLRIAKANNDYAMQREIYNQRAENARNAANNAVQIANIRASQFGIDPATGQSGINIEPFVMGAIDGTYSNTDLDKYIPQKGLRLQTNNILATNGFKPVTDKQKTYLQQIGNIIPAISTMDAVIAQLPKDAGLGGRIISKLGSNSFINPQLSQDLNRINAVTGNMMTIIGGDKGRFGKYMFERAEAGYTPDPLKPYNTNVDTRNKFVMDVKNVVDRGLNDLPENQRALIKKKYGLLDIGLLPHNDGKYYDPDNGKELKNYKPPVTPENNTSTTTPTQNNDPLGIR